MSHNETLIFNGQVDELVSDIAKIKGFLAKGESVDTIPLTQIAKN